jgi:hypothetical protein
MEKRIKKLLLGAIVFFAVIQVIRPARTNPPIDPAREITARLAVDPAVAGIFERSCNDCHSNLTIWPWYSNVAPVSWFVINHVRGGRRHMNFSDWAALPPQRVERDVEGICKETQSGGMPLSTYTPMHPLSKLTPADVDTLCRWSDATRTSLSGSAKTP